MGTVLYRRELDPKVLATTRITNDPNLISLPLARAIHKVVDEQVLLVTSRFTQSRSSSLQAGSLRDAPDGPPAGQPARRGGP